MNYSDVVVLIPAYNVEKTIKDIIHSIKNIYHKSKIIIVNDGSTDSTKKVVKNLDVIYLEHRKNLGKGQALITGFKKALEMSADIILTLDGDGQHDPNDGEKFLKVLHTSDYDIIIGNRMHDLKNMPVHRILSNKITSKLISWRIKQNIPDSQCGFRLLKLNILEKINLVSKRFAVESELLIKAGLAGYKIGSVPIKTIYHQNSKSSMNLITDTLRFIKLFISSFFW